LQFFICGVEQVVNVLHVNLHKGQTDWPFVLFLCWLQAVNYVV
jgi:hypothetical protein